MWTRAFVRLFMMLFVNWWFLVIPTFWATFRELDRLPWGLDKYWGCREDGWNGTGCDPDFPRQFWTIKGSNIKQGWWPVKLGVIWHELGFFSRWWYGWRWCAIRNQNWNFRLSNTIGTSIHFDDIRIIFIEVVGNKQTAIWYNRLDGKRYYFKRRKLPLLGWWDYGNEFYFEYFDPEHPWFKKVREQGYTFDVTPFKDRSIPSVRPRRGLNNV